MASPYDRLLGIVPPDEQGATQLARPENPYAALIAPPPDPTKPLLPTPAGTPVSAIAPQGVNPEAVNLMDPTRFLTLDQFFNSPGYKSALTPHKQDLEKEYAKTFLTPARMKAAGATQAQQADAMAEFARQKAKPETSKGWRGAFDTDLLDMPAYGLATAVGGAARVLGMDSLADRAAADAERIKRENFSPETRYKLEQEQYEAQKLAKKHGGEQNVPWWDEVVQGLSNFGRQPVNKTLQALGSSAPALVAAMPAAAGGAGVAAGYSLSVVANALLTAGDSAGGAYDKIMAMPESALQNSLEYVEARAEGQTHDEARKTVADRAVREATLMAAPLGAAAGALGMRFGAESLVAGVGKGVVRKSLGEAGQEAVEESTGQVIQNRAVQRADPEQRLTTGAFAAAAEGATAGAGTTVGVGALTRRANRGNETPPPAGEEGAQGDETPPANLPPSADPESAMRMPVSAWDNPVAPTAAANAAEEVASAPGNYAAPAAPDVVSATDDVPASTALKSLFQVGSQPEAAVTAMMQGLPDWIRTDTAVARLVSDMGETNPDEDPQHAEALADDLIGRVAFMQATEAARYMGFENPASHFDQIGASAARNQFLPSFTGRLWRPGVRDAFARQAKAAQTPGITPRPLPPGVAPATGAGPIQGTIVDPQDQQMTSAATGVAPVYLPDAQVSARPAAITDQTGENPDQGKPAEAQPQQEAISIPPRRDDVPVPPRRDDVPVPPRRDDVPVPPTPEQMAQRAIEQTGLLNDPAADWKKPNRKSRAAREFNEADLTTPILPAERTALLEGRPVQALESIAKRNSDSVLGQFATDLLRTMAGYVKTKAGTEVMKQVAARFSQYGGARGTITFNRNAPMTQHTVLHEFAHALTAQAIRNPVTERQKLAVKQLQRQMEWVSQNLPANHNARQSVVMGAFTDLAEFAAEVYTNPALQNYLKSVPSSAMHDRRRTRGNLWDMFIDGVSSLMKIKRTALMDTLMTLREIDDGRVNKEAEQASAQAPAKQDRSRGRGQPAAATVPAATGGTSGGGAASEAAPVSSGPDNPELPSTGTDAGDGNGAAGEDPRDPVSNASNPRSTGPTGTVADLAERVLADLPEPEMAHLLAIAASVGMSPEQMMTEAARRGISEEIKRVDPELAKTMEKVIGQMDLFAQSPLLLKANTVLDSVLSTPANIRQYEDLMRLGMTGEGPRINHVDSIWAKARERFVDSTTPFLKALGWDQNNPLWKKYKRGGSKLQEENKILNEQFADLNRAMNAFAREHGLPVGSTFDYIDRYTSSRYVANGANEELSERVAQKQQNALRALASLQNHIKSVRGANPKDNTLPALYARANSLQKIIDETNRWKENYDRLNDLVRGRDVDINGNSTERSPDQKFIGGMTRQEAKEFVATVHQRFGPAMDQVDEIAGKILGINRFWSDRALNAGLFSAKEASQWSQYRFKGGSGDFYVPITGNDNLKDQEEAYGIGGVFYKDYADEGRSTIGNGAYMSVVHHASSMARRIAYHEFNTELYNTARVESNPYGFKAVGVTDPTPGNKRTFIYKTFTGDGTPIVKKIALNDDAAADALVGANRQEVESSVMKGLSGFTSFFGFMVTQATLMFGPINAFRDFGEKTYTMVAKYGDIDKAKFLSGSVAQLANPENFKAAWDFAFGKANNTQAAKELHEFAQLGGLNTRTGSINREANKIISTIRKQSPGFKELGALRDAIGKYNEAWEIHSALATYRAVKASSKVPLEDTAFRILDSMNFGQSGKSSPFLRSLYLFFNPTVQGARNTYNTLLKDIYKNTPEGARARRAATVTLIGAFGLYAFAKALGGDDEDYGNRTDNLSTATVSRSIPIWIGGSFLRIPVPFGAVGVLWNIAVGTSRFASGAMTAPEAVMHMLQGAAEHTVPFPISQVDMVKDPGFWFMKTLFPQVLGPIVNIAARKNDFGDDLIRRRMPHEKGVPSHMLGFRKTDEAWKGLAKGFYDAGVGDFEPEKVKEFLRLGLVGPTESLFQWAIGVKEKEGDHGAIARALGVNRVYTNDHRGMIRAFYTAEQRAIELLGQVYGSAGEKPKNLRGDARKAAIANWIASSSITHEEQQVVQLYLDFEERLRKSRSGKSGEDERDVMRAYLRQQRALLGD